MVTAPKLYFVSGEFAGKEFEVGPAGLRLGRSSICDISIADEELSRNHCYFECSGPTGLRVTDLASANGTIVDGVLIGAEPYDLVKGSQIEVGNQTIIVGTPVKDSLGVNHTPDAGASVDLGLDASEVSSSSIHAGGEKAADKRKLLLTVIRIALVAFCIAAIFFLLKSNSDLFNSPAKTEQVNKLISESEQVPKVLEFSYEKVEADQSRIFRYAIGYSPDGVLSVHVDDVPDENRRPEKKSPLDDQAKEELEKILAWKNLKGLDPEYVGLTPDPPALKSLTLKVVYSTCVKTVRVVNMNEPEAFRSVRERLEAFSKSELGVWAIQYSRSKLLEMAEKSVELGESKWLDRDVEHGNLASSVAAYKEALFYLETINPKPPLAAIAREGMERSENLLKERCVEQRFRADRALNLKRWEEAKKELMTLIEMVPDRRDDRHRDAKVKLLTVETQIKRESGR